MKKPVVFALILAFITALFVFAYLNSLETKYRLGSEKVAVLVAKKYIDQTALLEKGFIEEKMIPKEYLQPRALQSMTDILTEEGRPIFMTIVPVEKGEQILATKLINSSRQTGISAITPTGMRAVTLSSNDPSLQNIKAGNRVDILAIMNYEDVKEGNQEVINAIFQNVLVIGVGSNILGDMPKMNKKFGGKFEMDDSEEGGSGISVVLMPEQAEELILISSKYPIRFVLRSIGDEEIYNSKGIKLKKVIQKRIDGAKCANTSGTDYDSKDDVYTKELQRQQTEALKLLKKYRKGKK